MSACSVTLDALFQRGRDCSGLRSWYCVVYHHHMCHSQNSEVGEGDSAEYGCPAAEKKASLALVTFPLGYRRQILPAFPPASPGKCSLPLSRCLTLEGSMVKGNVFSSQRCGFKVSSTLSTVRPRQMVSPQWEKGSVSSLEE